MVKRCFKSNALFALLALLVPSGAGSGLAGAGVGEPGAVQHLVLLKFRDETASGDVRQVLDEFSKLTAKIPGIRGLQWGTDQSPEKLSRGFTHGFVVTFESAAARDAYIEHPAHRALVELAKPSLEKVFAFDFDAGKPPPPADPGRVHHLVFFKFKDDAGAETLDKILAAFAALPQKVSGLISYQAGRDSSPEKLAQGFTHGFLLTLVNDRARDDYLVHPAHREFVELVRPALAEVLVLDFTVTPAAGSLFVTRGLEPFAVYQRDASGAATLRFGGAAADGVVEARIVSGRRVVAGFDWKAVGRAERGACRSTTSRSAASSSTSRPTPGTASRTCSGSPRPRFPAPRWSR